MTEFFLEVGTEEIPAAYIRPALDSLAQDLSGWFEKNRISAGAPQTLGTPRRLAISFPEVSEMQDDVVEVHKGPNVKAAYDSDGKPTKAALGFAKGRGVEVSQLEVEDTPKGQVIVARVPMKGIATAELLKSYLPELITALPFPKKMRWGQHAHPFARPVHWIVALLDGQTLDFEWQGVPSGDSSQGHRFLNPEAFKVTGLSQYLQECEAHSLVVDPVQRRALIQKQVEALAGETGGFVKPDDSLLDTVNYLVEFPNALLGKFEADYLKLPVELLEITMKHHQKYFPVWKNETELLPNFITISNMRADDPGVIVSGNQRVLRARLDDARFFFEEDRKRPLEEYLEDLKGVVFQKDLGTVFEKVERIQSIAVTLASRATRDLECQDSFIEKVRRAAALCKADLNTQMVFEFPELQGIMGGYYAAASGEAPEVAQAVKDHYKPAFAGDEPPSTLEGAYVALADKLDTIISCISVGLIPSGSEDPYALRRHSMGIIQILMREEFPHLTLEELVETGMACVADKAKLKPEEIHNHVFDLFRQRLKTLFSNQGLEHDVSDAVLATPIDSFRHAQAKAAALSDLKKQDYFESLAIAFRRVVSILEGQSFEAPDPALFAETAEKALWEKYGSIQGSVEKAIQGSDFQNALSEIVKIKPEVDAFFDAVMVNVDDPAVKTNRKALLFSISGLFSRIADFSKIVVKKS